MQVNLNVTDVGHDIMEVCVQTFDSDNYHRFSDEPSSELEKEAMRIRRKYRDVADFNRAITVYNEYMDLLAEKYGGWEIFSIRLKAGTVIERIPPKPGVRMNELNKFLIKNRMILSRKADIEVRPEVLEAISAEIDDQEIVSHGMVDIKDKKTVKELTKLIKTGSYKPQDRRSKPTDINAVTFLEEYFRNRHQAATSKKHEETQYLSLDDYASGRYLEMVNDTEDEEKQTVFFRGSYITQESADELELYKTLGEMGWDSMKLMRNSGVSKNTIRYFGAETKKERKKREKEERKKENSDSLMVQLFTDGNYGNFKDFKNELEDMRASNVFKKY